jgi:hypothetical protein
MTERLLALDRRGGHDRDAAPQFVAETDQGQSDRGRREPGSDALGKRHDPSLTDGLAAGRKKLVLALAAFWKLLSW